MYEIWAINPDGSGLEQLTYSAPALEPAWSPDGKRLAYSNVGVNAFIMEVGKPWKEQSPQPLPPLSEPKMSFVAWSWSSDGRMLAGYQQRQDGSEAGIAVCSLESRKIEKLTEHGNNPTWLKDNRRLLFSMRGKLQLLDTQSRKITEASPEGLAGAVSLSPDNRAIYLSRAHNEADVWLLSLE